LAGGARRGNAPSPWSSAAADNAAARAKPCASNI
jgi:hypothetical protein